MLHFQMHKSSTISEQEVQTAVEVITKDVIAQELKTIPIEEVESNIDEHIGTTRVSNRGGIYGCLIDKYYDSVYYQTVYGNKQYYRNKVTGKILSNVAAVNMFQYLLADYEKQLKQKGFVTSLDEYLELSDKGLEVRIHYYLNLKAPLDQPPQQRNDMYHQQQPQQMMQPVQQVQHWQQVPQQMMPQQPMMQQPQQPMMQQQPMPQQQPMMQQPQPQFAPQMMTPQGIVVHFAGVSQNGQPVYLTEQQLYQYQQQQRAVQMQQGMMPVHMRQNQMAQAIGSSTGGFFNNSAPVQQQAAPQEQHSQQVPNDGRPACLAFARKFDGEPTRKGQQPQQQVEPQPQPQPQQAARVQPVQQAPARGQVEVRDGNGNVRFMDAAEADKLWPGGNLQFVSPPAKQAPVQPQAQVHVTGQDNQAVFNPFNKMPPAGWQPNNQANMPGRGQNAAAWSTFPENDVDYQHVPVDVRPPWPNEAYMGRVFENIYKDLSVNPDFKPILGKVSQLKDRFYMLFGNIRSALSKWPAENTFIRGLGARLFGNADGGDCTNLYKLYLCRLAWKGIGHDTMKAEQEAHNVLAWYIKSATCTKFEGTGSNRRGLYNCNRAPLSSDQISAMEQMYGLFNMDNQYLIQNVIPEWFYNHNEYVHDNNQFESNRQRELNDRQVLQQSQIQHNAQVQAQKQVPPAPVVDNVDQQLELSSLYLAAMTKKYSDDHADRKANRSLTEQQKLENDQRFDEMIASSISGDEVPQASKPEYELVEDIVWFAKNGGNIYLPTINPYQETMEYRKYPNGDVRYCIMQMTDEEAQQAREEAIRWAARRGDIITEESLDQNNYPNVVVQNGTVELVDDGEMDVEEIEKDSVDNSIDSKVITLLAEAETVKRERHFDYYEDGTWSYDEQTDEEYTPVATDHVYVTKHRACVRDNDGDKDVFAQILKYKTLKDVAKYINIIRDGNSKRNSKQAADLVNQLITERINEFINHEVVINKNFHVEDFADEADGLLDRIEREVNDFTRKKVEEYQHYIIQSAYCNDVDLQTIVESMGKDDAKTANIIGVTQLHSVTVINQTAAELGLNGPQYSTEKSVMIRSQKLIDIVRKVFAHEEKRNGQHHEQYGKDQYVARHILATKDDKRFVFTLVPKDVETIAPIYFIRVMN